ncbi:hypothetical protein Taro_013667 [Colocasia esculenta]|uniref:AB hydrolase-1 domain-containing protein n=1 Tax=Colocasia esculenta TaxID=4460 RepID=A0A843UCJ3_COLES|nr:hypothetical protein [Colocasia esculenta]
MYAQIRRDMLPPVERARPPPADAEVVRRSSWRVLRSRIGKPRRKVQEEQRIMLISQVGGFLACAPPVSVGAHVQRSALLGYKCAGVHGGGRPARPYRCRMETAAAAAATCADADGKLRANFLQVLRSRRTAEVNLLVEKVEPITDPMYQGSTGSREVMESCPKKDIKDFKERLIEEKLMLITEAGEQGRLPVLILSLKENKQEKRPAIVFLHSSYKTKEWVRPLLEAYASRGYITVAIDSRYHGERAKNVTTYRDELVSAWKNGDTMPFLFDTVWDLIKLGDYLTRREDIDPARIGITGESLGGMHAWLAAAVDTRYSVVVPIIGVQGFRWAIDNDKWQARVDSIKPLFEEACKDLAKNVIDKEVVEKVWDRIAPGLASEFDSPYTIPAIAPRPLLILNGAEDPRCPLAGLDNPVSRADKAYREACLSENFKFIAEPGIGHQMTSSMVKAARGRKRGIDRFCVWFSFPSDMSIETAATCVDADSMLGAAFLRALRSRRTAEVNLSVEKAKPVTDPMFQGPTCTREAMESCPKEDIKDFQERLIEENLMLLTETGEQGRLPVLILSLKESKQEKRPAIVFLHSSYKNKEWMRPFLEAYASRGYIAVAIDSRYHGERAQTVTTYRDALVSAWKNGDTMPFLFDTVWDLIKLGDYLTQRDDIDPARIGITGVSLGGMISWFAAAVDIRYSVVVPIIGAQGFRWAIDNDKWQARVGSIKPVFEEAREDLGKYAIDKEVVEKVWDRIAPGLASEFDSPYTIPVIAPRPLLILNGAEDPMCPLAGLDTPVSRAVKAYREAGLPENFKFIAEPGVRHRMTPSMVKAASDWFDRFLK